MLLSVCKLLLRFFDNLSSDLILFIGSEPMKDSRDSGFTSLSKLSVEVVSRCKLVPIKLTRFWTFYC